MKLERVETPFGIFLSFPNDLITKQLRNFGAHQRNELSMLLDFVREGDTIIDVGAHIGTFAIPLAFKVGKHGCIFAFEADEENFDVLLENCLLNNCSDIIIPEQAVITLKKGIYKKTRRPGNVGATKFTYDPSGTGTYSKTIQLDSWHHERMLERKRIDVIKIDAEGMDADVLLSGKGLIEKYKPLIYIEISKKMKSYGYSRRDIQVLLESYDYHFFRNIGKRHSTNDSYTIGRLSDLRFGGKLFDLLAIHPSSDRYPKLWKSEKYMKIWYFKETLTFPTRAIRFIFVNIKKRLDHFHTRMN